MRPLSIAVGSYGLTQHLLAHPADAEGLQLAPVKVDPITKAMRAMVRNLEFDICEMAFTTYLCAKALGKPITAIPVFLTRNFHHRALFVKAGRGMTAPKQLEGRRVAVNRGYTVTTGLWARGALQHDYGVDLDTITWVPTDDEHVAEYVPPANVDMSFAKKVDVAGLLSSGNCDAAVGDLKTDDASVLPLIADPRAAGVAFFKRTGIYPLNHAVVIKTSVLEAAPSIARELIAAFAASKAAYLQRLDAGSALTPQDDAALSLGKAVGGDPFPYGIAANRPALEAIVQFCVEQHVIPRAYPIAELFAADIE